MCVCAQVRNAVIDRRPSHHTTLTQHVLPKVLLMADIGTRTTEDILSDVRRVAREDKLEPDDVKSVLRGRLVNVLEAAGVEEGVQEEGHNPRAIKFRPSTRAARESMEESGAGNYLLHQTTLGVIPQKTCVVL